MRCSVWQRLSPSGCWSQPRYHPQVQEHPFRYQQTRRIQEPRFRYLHCIRWGQGETQLQNLVWLNPDLKPSFARLRTWTSRHIWLLLRSSRPLNSTQLKLELMEQRYFVKFFFLLFSSTLEDQFCFCHRYLLQSKKNQRKKWMMPMLRRRTLIW